MAKTIKTRRKQGGPERYEKTLRDLQIELVKLQKHVIKHSHKVLVILEGRDASGKDGTIKRIVEHLSPRETRVVALGKPSDRDGTSWYFQRYVAHFARCAGVGSVQSKLVQSGGRGTSDEVLHKT